jgi:predicted RNase H-like HicB family nuclease
VTRQGTIAEAIQLCLEVEGDDAQQLDFVGVQRVAVG